MRRRIFAAAAGFLLGALALAGTACSKRGPARSSDWFASLPSGEIRRKLIIGCTSCHQLGPPVAYKSTAQEWEETIRKMQGFDEKLDLALIPEIDVAEVARWLEKHSKIPPHGRTVRESPADIKEYPAGPWESFYHDMEYAAGRAWIADYFGNKLYGVDPETGAVEEFAIPLNVPKGKPGGAHAINKTRDGALWITFTKAEQVARFDPVKKTFRVYSGFEKGANIQYFALDAERWVYQDPKGRIWMTQFSKEFLTRLDPRTGRIEKFSTPRTGWLPEKAVHEYAAVADSRGRLWYTETHGNRVGLLDPATRRAEEFELSEAWSGPKRLAIDTADRLWIPELAQSRILVFDTLARKVVERITLPIKGDYPYAIRRNPKNGEMWITGSGTDSLYRYDPRRKNFRIYRFPRRGAYTRTVAFDEKDNVWTCYASYPNTHTQMPFRSGVIVRLTPRD